MHKKIRGDTGLVGTNSDVRLGTLPEMANKQTVKDTYGHINDVYEIAAAKSAYDPNETFGVRVTFKASGGAAFWHRLERFVGQA